MVFLAVHTAGRKQAEHVQGRTLHCRIDGLINDRVRGELASFDCETDARQVLVYNSARAEVHVAHLGVTHLARRQADILTRSRDQRVRRAGPECIPCRGVRGGDRVAFGGGAIAESVQHDEQTGATRRVCHEWENLFWRALCGEGGF